MPDIKWIKLLTEMFDDEKIRIIEAMPEADTILVIWVRLICMAGKNNAGGRIYLSEDIPYTVEELSNIFNRPLNTVKLAMATFDRLRMVEYDEQGFVTLPNFERHQSIEAMDRIKENAAKRQKTFRERAKVKLLGTTEKLDQTVNTDFVPNNDSNALRNVTVTAQSRVDKSTEDKKIFTDLLNNIQNSILPRVFDLYFKDMQLVTVTENKITIAVKTEQVATYLENSVSELLKRHIEQVYGEGVEPFIVLPE